MCPQFSNENKLLFGIDKNFTLNLEWIPWSNHLQLLLSWFSVIGATWYFMRYTYFWLGENSRSLSFKIQIILCTHLMDIGWSKWLKNKLQSFSRKRILPLILGIDNIYSRQKVASRLVTRTMLVAT